MRTPRIIPLIPALLQNHSKSVLNSNKLPVAAWNFANTILWPQRQFSKEDICRTMESIHCYFTLAKDKKKTFTDFCERIVLTHKFTSCGVNGFTPHPAVWFNPHYEHGFEATKIWYQQVQQKREDVPGYLQHISVIASYYLDFTLNPSPKIFHKCRKKMLELNANSLLQHFYNAIIHLIYSIQ